MIDRQQRECWSQAYWLRHCTGYRVQGPEGPLGYVDQVLLDPEGVPRALVVRGERACLVSMSEIRAFLPGHEQIVVRGPSRALSRR